MIKLFSLKQQKKDGEASPRTGNQKKASAAQLRITKDINELNLPKTCTTEFPDPDDLLNFKLIICPDERVSDALGISLRTVTRVAQGFRRLGLGINNSNANTSVIEYGPQQKSKTEDLGDTLMMQVQNGFYRGGRFVFSFKVGPNYPHEPPKVKCETQVYHPNIDLQGNVCLNILREDWKPVLTINSIVYGLQYLFLEPNPEDPLNREAAEVLTNNRRLFEQNVQKAMRGGYVGGTYFERCLK